MSQSRRQGRSQLAFEDLLDPAYLDENLLAAGGGRKAANKQASKKKEAKGKLPGFRFRDSPQAGGKEGNRSADAAGLGLQQLMEIFGDSIDAATARQALQNGGSVEAAAAALSDLLLSPPAGASSPVEGTEVAVAASAVEADPEVCGWSSLPLELKEIIWGQCSVAQLARVATTCREFCTHLRTLRSTLKTLTVPPGLGRRALVGMVAAFGGATKVSAVKCRGDFSHQLHWQEFFQAVQAGSRGRKRWGGQPVTSMDLRASASLRDDDIISLLATIDTLEELDVSRSGISDRSLMALCDYQAVSTGWEAAQDGHSTNDGSLRLPGNAALGSQVTDGDDRSFSRQRNSIEAGFQNVIHQTSRGVVESHKRRSGRGLLSLNLAGCPNITSKGIKALISQGQTAKSLQKLNVSGGGGMDIPSVELSRTSSLRILKAQRCHKLSKLVVTVQEGQMLEEVDLSGCSQLARVEVRAGHLRDLNLSGCGRLRDTSRPSCVVMAPALTRLVLAQCHLVSGVHQGTFPRLRELNLHGCREIQDTAFQALVQPARELRRLIACGCSLKQLSMEGYAALGEVDVSGCSRLQGVALLGAALTKFSAKHCVALEDVEVRSRKLRDLDLLNCSQLASLRTDTSIAWKDLRLCVCGCERLTLQNAALLRHQKAAKECKCRGA